MIAPEMHGSEYFGFTQERNELTTQHGPRVIAHDIATIGPDGLAALLRRRFNVVDISDPYQVLRDLITDGVIASRHEDDAEDVEEKLGDFRYISRNVPSTEDAIAQYRNFRSGSVLEFVNFRTPGVYPWRFTLPRDLYREVTLSRSAGMFEREVYPKFMKAQFAIVGMGVGSSIMQALVQHGAENVVCFDGGNIRLHDSNRQNGGMLAIGMNHARHAVEDALLFNPWGNYVAHERNVELDVHGKLVDLPILQQADVVIEEVDALHIKQVIRQQVQRPIFMFTDLGFASARRFDQLDPISAQNPFGLTDDEREELRRMHLSKYAGVPTERKTYFASKMIGSLSPSFIEAQTRIAREGGVFWYQPKASADRTANLVMKTMQAFFRGEQIPSYLLD